jgi:hypothetical protein
MNHDICLSFLFGVLQVLKNKLIPLASPSLWIGKVYLDLLRELSQRIVHIGINDNTKGDSLCSA